MVEEGRFRGGNAPYGYRLEKSGIFNKRKHEVYMLVIDEDEARVVRMMFDLCVSSGYGRWRLANFLNDHGIKNRKGQNWHDASVGGILHNPLYKGILRSGETYAGPFDELQIIAPDHFDLAQKLMLERTNERKRASNSAAEYDRTVPALRKYLLWTLRRPLGTYHERENGPSSGWNSGLQKAHSLCVIK